MPNINDVDPGDIARTQAPVADGADGNIHNLAPNQVQSQDDYYSSPGQQLATTAEGLAQGVLGPLAPAIEQGLGITTGADIRGRAHANPITHGLSEAAGFAGSLAIPGLGEAGLAGQVGNIGEHAAALLPEGAGIIARSGIKASAEMAALTTSDELSKMVTQDPNQTLGSAAINVGLSGLIGGTGGVALGGISQLWNKSKNLLGVDQLLEDFQNESQAIRDAKNPDLQGLDQDNPDGPVTNLKATPGTKLARWVDAHGAGVLSKSLGEAVGSTIGGGLGAIVGHPIIGAIAGEKTLTPLFSALAKPFAENVIDAPAAKAAVDYVIDAIRGQKLLSDSISNVFGKGSEVIAKDLIPDQSSRDQLQKSIDYASNPQNALNVGGTTGHYLPDHATALGQTTAQAVNYFNALKPTQPTLSPLDKAAPIDPAAQAKYNRALDVAQQPLLVLQHVKDGKLLPQDVQTLNTVYPGLQKSMVSGLTKGLIDNKAQLAYPQRVSMNLLMGQTPLDSTLSPIGMQAIINSASPKSQVLAQQTKSGKSSGHATSATLNQIDKVNSLYATSLQARQIGKRQ